MFAIPFYQNPQHKCFQSKVVPTIDGVLQLLVTYYKYSASNIRKFKF